MATTKPRITVTLTPELHSVLQHLAHLNSCSQSSIVLELMQDAVPILQRIAHSIELSRRVKHEAKAGLLAHLDESQRKMETALQSLSDLLPESASVQSVLPLRDEAQPAAKARPRRAVGSARPPLSNRGVRSATEGANGKKGN